MPDRPLTEEEQKKIAVELTTEGKVARFRALDALMKEKVFEGSLYDYCFNELLAKTDSLKQILIEQGRDIEFLKIKLKQFFKDDDKGQPRPFI
jgi:hypothetical protein